MIKLNPNLKPLENESEEHFMLKQVAMAILYLKMGCQAVGTEVDGMHESESERYIQFARFLSGGPIQLSNRRPYRYITDAAGVGSKWFYPNWKSEVS
jgi:hypothetical protein